MNEDSYALVIRGGKELSGAIAVNGAKNDVLSLMAASVVFSHPVTLTNVPRISDVAKMKALLEGIGVRVTEDPDKRTITLDPSSVKNPVLDAALAEKIRASVMLIGPVMARLGEITFPYPGGCVIGKRPIDFFINGFKKLGADVTESDTVFSFRLKKHTGGNIVLPYPSVTVTETLMINSALGNGTTTITNAACEPEIESLAQFLGSGGAHITGAGTHTITVQGTNGRLLAQSRPEAFPVLPDRIEAGSFAILASLLGNPIRITQCAPRHIESLLERLRDLGVSVRAGNDWIEIRRPKQFTSVDIKTGPYPAFATDLQAPFTVLLTQAGGKAVVFETVFEERLHYIEELKQMGANITLCDPHRAIVVGPTPLSGRAVKSPDLRAGLAFIIAGLIAKGESVIHNVYHIDRGYEDIEARLRALGASIERRTL
ncbi:MAG: UDP-N-acetylglucosamine 1-carboxyvinyltransferase [Candidatus Niyogibacteria bacterium CG10_big_fil_rev_8_21_14_0_10_46_36]|uniref:UDP-N-acetylglucosamine 1-carboxyvinyltransferase n=1 Tax=Candidatus Niyogibacteria bacterium CG10_big_fil_rev_8_21_14_0_10_46_36 TaxID=1974726 RepID=A0A2H0TE42_9BACT|nr:MAG: UDP-N-acetylglucosamine 1-carboxyvinyltransferase [Candidatus Niyogibacteria bacterium CG10_big_fil_rev_8_21_14_0_10_46_36]